MTAPEHPPTIGETRFTIDDLSDYLDSDRTPVIPEIENSPECRAMLDSLERVGALSRELIARDVELNPTIDERWLGGLIASIGREVKAGRDIPLASADPATSLSITEGAVRELVRVAGDSIDGVLVGSCAIDGDLMLPAEPLRVAVTISVVLNGPVTALADAVRQRVYSELLKHTELTIGAVDVTVTDVHQLTRPIEENE